MLNFTNLGYKEIIEHGLERKQLALLIRLDFYRRTQKSVTKKQICQESSILPESFNRSINRLRDSGLLSDFNYNKQSKRVGNSFQLSKSKALHVQVPTYLIKLGALTNSALAVLGYLKAIPKGEWDGSCYKLQQKINHWFKKHDINYSLSLTSIYKGIKLLQTLKLVEKIEHKFLKNGNWFWNIKIKLNQEIATKMIAIFDFEQELRKLTIKLFAYSRTQFKEEIDWSILD